MGAFGTGVSTQSDCLFAYGTATAPSANDVIATITAPDAGLYMISVKLRLATGLSISVADNYLVKVGTVTKYRILSPALSISTTSVFNAENFLARCTRSQTITIVANGNEAASVGTAFILWAKKIAN